MPNERKESIASCYERVLNAAHILATGSEVIQVRLLDAALSIGVLDVYDFPASLRPRFAAIHEALTAHESFEESAKAMSVDRAKEVAELVFDLAVEVVRREAIEDLDQEER